jgi:signal transduction histidine kinase
MKGERRWEITPAELQRLRNAVRRTADRTDLDAALSVWASWALALSDASAIVVAVADVPGGPPLLRAVAGRGPRDRLRQPVLPASLRGWLRAPVRVGAQDVGLVAARPPRGQPPDERDAELMKVVAAQAAMAISQERADLRVAVARATEEAAAAERARLARELHDETAQQLVAIGRQLDLLEMETGDEALRERLGEVHDMVDQALADVRRISRDLRPAILEDLGLKAAVEALAADCSRGGDVEVTVRLDGLDESVTPRIELAMYRIVQEALTNCQRHAGARRVTIRLAGSNRDALVEVADDGAGFDATSFSAVVKGGGMGLLGMRERVEEVGGRLEIDSAPGRGTLIRARVPLGRQPTSPV